MRYSGILVVLGGMAFVTGCAGNDRAAMRVVPSVDLERYAGKWYEIARLPNRFQRACASDTTATYTLRPELQGAEYQTEGHVLLAVLRQLLDHRSGPGVPVGCGGGAGTGVSLGP